ncbi:hypothetical protein AGDE_13998 [Angomonas deanei]|nr:hypothetical protein AGDE_13998 [Angomonas deanei]|eukprot:EPY21566.1 hypothetical protein AGDE_13998 [Angomonas deanei]
MLYMQSLMNNAQENRERDEDDERPSGHQNSEQPFFLQPAPQRCPETANLEGAGAKRGKNRWQTKKKVFCTTERLETLCGHAKHFAENIIAEELKKILPLFQQIKANISYLQALGEALSLLDMLASFTEYSLLFNAVRPQFDNQMPGHVLRDFVHPSMVVKQAGNANFCVPNTIFWQDERGDKDDTKEKLILTLSGSNNSGKTTLLRMVSQIQILCQIGCFIPLLNRGDEDSNHVVLFDKICGHLMCDSLPQIETSSFRRELLELADMMKELDEMEDSNALLLFDELGRSTNTRESFTLCCAVMRYIIEKQKQNHAARGDEEEEGAMKRRSNVFLGVFSTHFKSLIQLSGVFAEIDNFYFGLMCNEKHDENHGKNGTTKITVSHQLCHGVGEVNKSNVNYGLHLAKHLGLPSLIVDNAFKLLSKTEKKGS